MSDTSILENPQIDKSVDEIIDDINTPLTAFSHWTNPDVEKIKITQDQFKNIVDFMRKKGIPDEKIKQSLRKAEQVLIKKAS